MAKNSTSGVVLPIAVIDSVAEAEGKQLKRSAVSKTGAYAAVAYMACAVISPIEKTLINLATISDKIGNYNVLHVIAISPGILYAEMLLVLFNKAALSSYSFPCANVITLCQMISSCCFLYVLRRLKLISFSSNESGAITDNFKTMVSIQTLKYTSPISATYLFYMLASMEAVRGVNVPMYTTIRRTTVVFTMLLEYILMGQMYSRPVLGSVAIILLGAFVAGANDMAFDFYGYLVVVMANISTALYLTTIARIGKSSGLNSFGLMWCNGILCGPVLLVWIFVQGDLEKTMNFPYLFSPGFLIVMLFSCILAFLLNYSVFLNTTLNSALTQTICGNLKDFFTIGLGWIIFGGLAFDLLNVSGQLVCFVGSGMYAFYKLTGN